MFDVNIWGAINVPWEATRFFRDTNKLQGGRLCSVTSGAGSLPTPAFGWCCASEFGILGNAFRMVDGDPLPSPAHEGVVSTLAAEMAPN